MYEVDTVVGQVVPVVGAAVAAYGAGVLARAEDGAADATVRPPMVGGLSGRSAAT